MLNTRTVVLLSVALGVMLELGTEAIGGRREAWDSPLYWRMGLPVAAIAAATFGYLSRRSAWVGSLAIVPAQVFDDDGSQRRNQRLVPPRRRPVVDPERPVSRHLLYRLAIPARVVFRLILQ